MSDKTLMVYCHGTHQEKAQRKRAEFLTHPPNLHLVFLLICDNISRSVSLHELYPVWTSEAIKLVSKIIMG